MMKRRNFMKTIGLATAGLFARPFINQAHAYSKIDFPEGAELYGQFIILPQGAPMPAGITPLKYGVPNLCGTGEDGPGLTAAISQKADLDALVSDSPFRVLALNPMPEHLHDSGGYILRHRGGPVYSSVYTYTFTNLETKEATEAVRIVSVADFYIPYPIWAPTNEPDRKDQSWIKTTVNNEPAILISTAAEFVLYWMLGDQLNTAIINKSIPDLSLETYLAQIKEIN